MRKGYENNLLDLIRAIVIDGDNARAAEIACTARATSVDTNSEYDLLYSFAKWHQIQHLVDYAMHCVQDSVATSNFYSSASMTIQQADAARKASETFSNAEIDHILLKGTVIRDLYPERWMRNSCDIDILVRDEDLAKASDVLKGLGYEQIELVTIHDISFYKGILHIELHYRLIEDFRIAEAAAILNNLWDYAVPTKESKHMFVLPDDLAYLYHVAHMAKHFGDGGCGIRPVLDTWILNNRWEHDRAVRDVLLKQAGLDKFEDAIRRLSEYWFGSGSAEGLADIERYIFKGGAYGNSEQRHKVKKSRTGRLGYILSRAFMGYKPLCYKYPVLKKHPYLFPIMEIWRWHEFFGTNHKNHAKELKDTLKMSEDVKEMIRELGLSEFR